MSRTLIVKIGYEAIAGNLAWRKSEPTKRAPGDVFDIVILEAEDGRQSIGFIKDKLHLYDRATGKVSKITLEHAIQYAIEFYELYALEVFTSYESDDGGLSGLFRLVATALKKGAK